METRRQAWEALKRNLEKFAALQDDPNANLAEINETRRQIEMYETILALHRKAA